MTDVAQLPQFKPQIGEPFFRVPNAGMRVSSLALWVNIELTFRRGVLSRMAGSGAAIATGEAWPLKSCCLEVHCWIAGGRFPNWLCHPTRAK